ncbi:hypothetical protein WM40_24465 [Robbsia andropogonis]|uniref:Chemotaxis protein n=1 Tax=Robbsia andropogonis TaxID=28092 RepID=A0A0F5JTP2_9BURK|nr:hypothetical protein [Robbsia andropogonis]KKB61206.1 hypothetical protein WM40_24465 [Robbsia andropogonis]
MDTGEILKLLGGSTVGGGVLATLAYAAVKMAIPAFAKARLDSSSLGVAEKLIESLQEQNKAQAEEHRAAMVRADEALKAERDRADATRKVLEETTAELYKVREQLSHLTNENIKLAGKIAELERKMNAHPGVNDAL